MARTRPTYLILECLTWKFSSKNIQKLVLVLVSHSYSANLTLALEDPVLINVGGTMITSDPLVINSGVSLIN